MQRVALIKTSTDREEALNNTQATVVELEKESQSSVSQLDPARAILATAVEARSAAEGRVALAQSLARIKALAEEIAELDRRLPEMDTLVAEQTAARHRLIGIKIHKRT